MFFFLFIFLEHVTSNENVTPNQFVSHIIAEKVQQPAVTPEDRNEIKTQTGN